MDEYVEAQTFLSSLNLEKYMDKFITNGIEDCFVCAVVNKINIYFDIYLNKKSLLYLFLKFYVMIVNLKK